MSQNAKCMVPSCESRERDEACFVVRDEDLGLLILCGDHCSVRRIQVLVPSFGARGILEWLRQGQEEKC